MPNEIRFYRASGEFAYLSNLFVLPSPLKFLGGEYPTSEHAYQAGKPRDAAVVDWLMAAPSPALVAQVAHALFPWQVCEGWSGKKVDRMRAVIRAKFAQFPELGRLLVATGDAALIEESKMDAFWGLGAKGNGKNMLGVLLTEVRAEYRVVFKE